MSRIRGEGRSSKQAARYPSKIRAPLPLSIRSNSFLQSYLISRLCKLQGRAVNSRGSSRTRRWAPRSGSCSCSSSYLRSPRRSEPLPFSLPRLSPSLIHLHLPYTTAQHQQGNTKRKKAPSQTLSLAQICFTY